VSYYEHHKEKQKKACREWYHNKISNFTRRPEELKQFKKERSDYYKRWYRAKRQAQCYAYHERGLPKAEPEEPKAQEPATALSFSFAD
jgi:hypothetical protein